MIYRQPTEMGPADLWSPGLLSVLLEARTLLEVSLPVTQGVAGRAGCILEYGFVLKRTRGFANTARTRPARRRLDSWERASKASRSSTLLPPNRRWEGLGGGSGTSLSYHRHKGHTIQAMHMRKRLSGSGCTCSQSMAPWQADQPTHETIKHNSSRWRTYAPESRRVNACVMVALTLTSPLLEAARQVTKESALVYDHRSCLW